MLAGVRSVVHDNAEDGTGHSAEQHERDPLDWPTQNVQALPRSITIDPVLSSRKACSQTQS
jgi:hypothetical protein